MTDEWNGEEYNLLNHNCCHFCDAFCRRLGVGPTPQWVTNLAGAGARLVNGVAGAANAVNEIVGVAAERAAELDQQFDILRTVDSFTNREITIDESYLQTKVQGMWAQAMQNIESVAGPHKAVEWEPMKPVAAPNPVEA